MFTTNSFVCPFQERIEVYEKRSFQHLFARCWYCRWMTEESMHAPLKATWIPENKDTKFWTVHHQDFDSAVRRYEYFLRHVHMRYLLTFVSIFCQEKYSECFYLSGRNSVSFGGKITSKETFHCQFVTGYSIFLPNAPWEYANLMVSGSVP